MANRALAKILLVQIYVLYKIHSVMYWFKKLDCLMPGEVGGTKFCLGQDPKLWKIPYNRESAYGINKCHDFPHNFQGYPHFCQWLHHFSPSGKLLT